MSQVKAAPAKPRVSVKPTVDAEPLTDRGRRTRAQLVESARTVFEAKGYPSTTMNDIAETAGVSHGTVYTYFNDKRDVFLAVAEDMRDRLAIDWRVGHEDADTLTRIEEGNRNTVTTFGKHIRMFEILDQAAADDPEFRQLSIDIRQRYVERSVAGIRRLQADGKVDTSIDAYLAGSALCGMVEGIAMRWILRHEEYDPEMIIATLTTLWTNALGLTETDKNAGTRGKATKVTKN